MMAQLKEQVIHEAQKIDGVESRPSPIQGGVALFYFGKAFAHFHNDNELDLRLTKKVIKALGLSHPSGSTHHPGRSANSPWIEVGFHDARDVARLIELIGRAVATL